MGTGLAPESSQVAFSASNVEWTSEFAKVVQDVITVDNTASVARLTTNSTNQNLQHFNDPRGSLQSSNNPGNNQSSHRFTHFIPIAHRKINETPQGQNEKLQAYENATYENNERPIAASDNMLYCGPQEMSSSQLNEAQDQS